MVKFVKKFRNYQPGETAGFSKSHEQFLIERKLAERFIPPVKEATVAKTATKDDKTEPGKNPDAGNVNKQTTVRTK